jgi:hypothetical protein
MKLLGYCEQCQRICRVNVHTSFLAAGLIRGICDECREKERREREERGR